MVEPPVLPPPVLPPPVPPPVMPPPVMPPPVLLVVLVVPVVLPEVVPEVEPDVVLPGVLVLEGVLSSSSQAVKTREEQRRVPASSGSQDFFMTGKVVEK